MTVTNVDPTGLFLDLDKIVVSTWPAADSVSSSSSSAAATATGSSAPASSAAKSNTAVIVGSVVPSVVVATLLVLAALFFIRRRRKQAHNFASDINLSDSEEAAVQPFIVEPWMSPQNNPPHVRTISQSQTSWSMPTTPYTDDTSKMTVTTSVNETDNPHRDFPPPDYEEATSSSRRGPLPDERPRQSVANLIGRFEQQTKRQSLTHVPPRSSTPVSHAAGDNAKEEVKEKREWPPKLKHWQKEPDAQAAGSVSLEPPAEASLLKPSLPTPDASPKPEAVELPVSPPPVPPPAPASDPLPIPDEKVPDTPASPPPAHETPVVEPVASKPAPSRQSSLNSQAPATALVPVPATASASARTTSATTKARPIGAPRTSATATKVARPSTATKSPPASYHAPPSVRPTTPSNAARAPASVKQSPAASHALRQPRPSSSASMRPPLTPARAKTPSTTRPRTPASTSRPKTPSAGLFAPTAASLAKARNAPDMPPLPVKKHSLNSDVMDRLSKPTASSLSKARIGAATSAPVKTSPVKRGAPPTRGTTPGRGTSAKPKPGAASAKPREKAAVAKSAATPAAASRDEDSAPHVEHEEEHVEHGEPVENAEYVPIDENVTHELEEHHEHVAEVVHDEPVEEPKIDQHEDQVEVVVEVEAEPVAHEQSEEFKLEPAETHVVESLVDDVAPASTASEDKMDEQPQSPSPGKAPAGEDLEDLIAMLEAKNPPRPTLPDIAGEIPDEE
ncbi:hypothetical protein EIP86_006432 [Pleurotus ostreatoroseus]|nr:hypothetical protein EIP86_006432 [Pleurotus ostreatoroseus]